MWGQRIEIAKQSLLYFLKSLPDNNSNFNVISFGSKYMPLYENCVVVNEENIEKAINQVYEFKADMGGTELKGALQYIESLAKNSGLPPSKISVPRPAIFVAIVTAPTRPAWAIISASFKWFLAFKTLCLMP